MFFLHLYKIDVAIYYQVEVFLNKICSWSLNFQCHVVTKKGEAENNTRTPLLQSDQAICYDWLIRLSKCTTWPTTLIYIRTHCLITSPNSKWRAHNIDARALYWISTNTASVHKNQQDWIPQIKSLLFNNLQSLWQHKLILFLWSSGIESFLRG
jgi:hypothetical protein